jgi:hypothetical protein
MICAHRWAELRGELLLIFCLEPGSIAWALPHDVIADRIKVRHEEQGKKE